MNETALHKEKIIAQIIEYIQSAFAWHQQGAPTTIDDGPGLLMTETEEQIMLQFGLPPHAFYFSEIMQLEGFSIDDIETRAEQLYYRLVQEAETFLLSSPATNVALLREAREHFKDLHDVLPYMGIQPTLYHSFLYNDVFLMGRCDENEMLHYCAIAIDFAIACDIIIPYGFEGILQDDVWQRLRQIHLPYLDEYKEYLQYIATDHDWNIDAGEACVGNLPDVITLEEFYINHIDVEISFQAHLIIIAKFDGKYHKLNVWMEPSSVPFLLRQSRYYSDVAAFLLHFISLGDENPSASLNIKDTYSMNFDINKCYLEIQYQPLLDTMENDEAVYTVNMIIPKEEMVSTD